jgi:hypothetical protein
MRGEFSGLENSLDSRLNTTLAVKSWPSRLETVLTQGGFEQPGLELSPLCRSTCTGVALREPQPPLSLIVGKRRLKIYIAETRMICLCKNMRAFQRYTTRKGDVETTASRNSATFPFPNITPICSELISPLCRSTCAGAGLLSNNLV